MHILRFWIQGVKKPLLISCTVITNPPPLPPTLKIVSTPILIIYIFIHRLYDNSLDEQGGKALSEALKAMSNLQLLR